MEGKLKKNECGRWVIFCELGVEAYESSLTSGSVCEINVAGHWIRTRIEHNGKEYYATVPGVKLYTGMPARFGDGI